MPPTLSLHGIDGCPAGWLVTSWHPDENISAHIYSTLEQFASQLSPDHIVAIDMPIGMPCPSHYPRACDTSARQALGSRACCVFSAPCRGVLDYLHDYRGACSWHKEATGKGISCQAFNILPKIHQLDNFLSSQPAIASFHEVHPEISFTHINGGDHSISPLLTRKASPEGAKARGNLIEQAFPGNMLNPAAIESLQQSLGPKTKHGKTRWALNDLHDALAALWSAHRIHSGEAITYPGPADQPASQDHTGKTMLIKA